MPKNEWRWPGLASPKSLSAIDFLVFTGAAAGIIGATGCSGACITAGASCSGTAIASGCTGIVGGSTRGWANSAAVAICSSGIG